MIDLNSSSLLSDRINQHLDVALEDKNRKEPPRDYLGGSRVGVECDRALQFEFFNTPKDEGKHFKGRTLRIFARGFWVEDAMIGWMRNAGFDIRDRGEDGKQYGFSIHGGLVKGHCDGVLFSGPVFETWPRLWECKGLNEKGVKALKKHKLKKEKPVYYAQCQFYMEHFELTENPALFSAVNMNNMEIHWEEVKFDPKYEQQLNGKASRVLQSCKHGELLPRMRNDPEYYLCKWCDWHDRCYALNI